MSRWFWGLLALSAVVVAVALAISRRGGPSNQQSLAHVITQTPEGPEALHASLDLDTSDGPCTDIDDSAEHDPAGANYNVAICVEGLYEGFPIGVAAFDVIYDDTLNSAPDGANSGQGLDDNPNFNENEYGDGLGSGW